MKGLYMNRKLRLFLEIFGFSAFAAIVAMTVSSAPAAAVAVALSLCVIIALRGRSAHRWGFFFVWIVLLVLLCFAYLPGAVIPVLTLTGVFILTTHMMLIGGNGKWNLLAVFSLLATLFLVLMAVEVAHVYAFHGSYGSDNVPLIHRIAEFVKNP